MPASTTLHETPDKLSNRTIEFHRAITSLGEELEARVTLSAVDASSMSKALMASV